MKTRRFLSSLFTTRVAWSGGSAVVLFLKESHHRQSPTPYMIHTLGDQFMNVRTLILYRRTTSRTRRPNQAVHHPFLGHLHHNLMSCLLQPATILVCHSSTCDHSLSDVSRKATISELPPRETARSTSHVPLNVSFRVSEDEDANANP